MVYQLPPNNFRRLTEDIECPRCGRQHSIVQHGAGRYFCLACDWFRDLNREARYPSKIALFLFSVVAILVVGRLINQA